MEAAEYLPEVLPLKLGGMKTHPSIQRHAQVAILQDMLQFMLFLSNFNMKSIIGWMKMHIQYWTFISNSK